MVRFVFVVSVAVVIHAEWVGSQNWPSFRGPRASGISDGAELPDEWDVASGRNILWKTAIPGLGHSSPIVWGNRIFLTTAVSEDPNSFFSPDPDGKRDQRSDVSRHSWRVLSIDKSTGEIVWERESHRGKPKIQRHRKNSYATPTPATDGRHLVVWFGSEGLYCYDFHGNLLWEKDLGIIDAGASYDNAYDWGVASSPVIYRNLVIILGDGHGDSFIAAFDIANGREIWRRSRDAISSYSTPTICESPSRVELVVNGPEKVYGYDPLTGEELWMLRGSSKNTTPTPILAADLIIVASGYRIKPIFAIRPGAKGDITPVEGARSSTFVAWSLDRDGPYLPTPLAYGDYLYVCQNNGVLACHVARTGERVYRQRLGVGGAFSASPVAADGKLYVSGEDGNIFVVRTGPRFELLATNDLGELVMATPALSQGRMFIRTQHHLVAVGDTSSPE
jgi:outer membrane protein assembly factor BamB